LIQTKLLETYRNLGQYDEAGTLFLRLVKSDPQTPAFRHMPVAWTPTDVVASEQARRWLAHGESPAAVVLGASHLMATTGRPEAMRALSTLRSQLNDHPELASLAEAQAWRAQHSNITLAMVDLWARRADSFPEVVRAGPYFVVACSYEQLKQVDRAELYYMRVSVLYPEQRLLASRALTAAARLSGRSGHPEESRTLLEEIIVRYEDTPERALAEQELKNLLPTQE
jgi:tetratricopeptide (TPR) repeat protein